MNLKFPLFALVAMLASACSNTATGQKERAIALTSTNDSVSYSIGTDIGRNIHTQMKQSGLDSLNYDAMFAGMRDAIDSTDRISEDRAKDMVQTYMMAAQQKVMAKKQAEGEAQKAEGEKFLAENSKKPGVITTTSGLQYEVVTMGKGPKPAQSDTVRVNYEGKLLNGNVFDSSYKNGAPIDYPVAKFVPGWVEALQLMPTGSKFKLYVPSELAYGARGAGEDIPPNSTLVFELELLDILHNAKP